MTDRDDTEIPVICKTCGAMNKPYPAKPVIVKEQDGSYSCSYCGASWRLSDKVK
jgi:uncharacterized Zn-finger protein